MIFVVSDFHGNLNAWESLKKALNEEDTCYVLGDACDRGKHGVQILSEIMEDKRFRYIVGNHDDFVIRTFRSDLIYSFDETSRWAKYCWLNNDGPSYNEWMEMANTNPTNFVKMLDWLAECNVYEEVCVAGKIFRLAHAKYPKNMKESNMSWKKMERYYHSELFSTIWDRYCKCASIDDIQKQYVSSGCITLIGHTPIPNQDPKVIEGLYNLDTGLGYGYDEVTVFCMNDCQLYTIQNGKKLPKGSNEERI